MGLSGRHAPCASVSLYDSIHIGKTKARPPFFVAEKGVENIGKILRADSGSVVADFDLNGTTVTSQLLRHDLYVSTFREYFHCIQ